LIIQFSFLPCLKRIEYTYIYFTSHALLIIQFLWPQKSVLSSFSWQCRLHMRNVAQGRCFERIYSIFSHFPLRTEHSWRSLLLLTARIKARHRTYENNTGHVTGQKPIIPSLAPQRKMTGCFFVTIIIYYIVTVVLNHFVDWS